MDRRLQKLLTTKYKNFLDTILVESSFAETYRDGQGIRQVALGLTLTKLIVAIDNLSKSYGFLCPRNLDPSIETLELVSVIPLEDVSLKVFCRKRRKTLKATLIDGNVNYYELGEMDRKHILWDIWCNHIQSIISQKENDSSLSETTVSSTTSSTSTCYSFLKIGSIMLSPFGARDNISASWTRKDMYLGPLYNDIFADYIPLPIKMTEIYDQEYIKPRQIQIHKDSTVPTFIYKNQTLIPKLSRIGFGIEEKCASGLYLPTHKSNEPLDFDQLIEHGVKVWEKKLNNKTKSIRRYGLVTAAHFLYALGPWSVQPGDQASIKHKSMSLMSIRRESMNYNCQLSRSISMTLLRPGKLLRGEVVLFWTPKYWYRPIVTDKKPLSQMKYFSKKYYNDLMRKLMKINSRVSAWDLDSTTIAKQLTMIDCNLFIRISINEIHSLIVEKSSKNTPNLGAWIAFSHRISCLTASEILAIKKLDKRARIMARFINAAKKCYSMGNFQSCRSILSGLQSLPIYRLQTTWRYLKTHHSNKYFIMAKLCKIFKNPRTTSYEKAWLKAEQCPPVIPYVGHILIKLLGFTINSNVTKHKSHWDGGSTFLTHELDKNSTFKNQPKMSQIISVPPTDKKLGIIKRILSLIKLLHPNEKSPRKSIYWAANQFILARKYYNRWQTFVMVNKIINKRENDIKLLNDKTKQIQEFITSWIIYCQQQAQNYNFTGHLLALDFLLKTRYQEDRENFITSKNLEPRPSRHNLSSFHKNI